MTPSAPTPNLRPGISLFKVLLPLAITTVLLLSCWFGIAIQWQSSSRSNLQVDLQQTKLVLQGGYLSAHRDIVQMTCYDAADAKACLDAIVGSDGFSCQRTWSFGDRLGHAIWLGDLWWPGHPPARFAVQCLSSVRSLSATQPAPALLRPPARGYASRQYGMEFAPLPVAIPLLLPLLVACWRYLQYRRRQHHGLCPSCGYDLRATSTCCPECGRQIPVIH